MGIPFFREIPRYNKFRFYLFSNDISLFSILYGPAKKNIFLSARNILGKILVIGTLLASIKIMNRITEKDVHEFERKITGNRRVAQQGKND